MRKNIQKKIHKVLVPFLIMTCMIAGVLASAVSVYASQSTDQFRGNAYSLAVSECNSGHTGSYYWNWYNGSGKTDGWCALFVSYVLSNSGLNIDKVSELGYSGFYTSPATQISAYQNLGIYHTKGDGYTPQAGDVIFYRNPGGKSGYHSAVVTGVDGSKIMTAQGNVGYANPLYIPESYYKDGNGQCIILGYGDSGSLYDMINGGAAPSPVAEQEAPASAAEQEVAQQPTSGITGSWETYMKSSTTSNATAYGKITLSGAATNVIFKIDVTLYDSNKNSLATVYTEDTRGKLSAKYAYAYGDYPFSYSFKPGGSYYYQMNAYIDNGTVCEKISSDYIAFTTN